MYRSLSTPELPINKLETKVTFRIPDDQRMGIDLLIVQRRQKTGHTFSISDIIREGLYQLLLKEGVIE